MANLNGGTIRSTVDALRSSPLMLGLILLNVIFMGAIFFAIRQDRDIEFQMSKATAAQTDTLIKLLAECKR